MEILRAENIHKKFIDCNTTLHILKGTDFIVSTGDLVSIQGQSGSGKSTLLHILGLLDTPNEGEVFYNGKPIVYNKNLAELRNRKIGFIFQFHYLLEDFDATDNIAMPMFVLTGDLKKSRTKANELLKKLDIYDRRNHYPNQLSGGEQQRVAIARAMINSPEIIFADEPTGNLDPDHKNEIMDIVLSMNREYNQTFVIVTHDDIIADKMKTNYILKDGIIKNK